MTRWDADRGERVLGELQVVEDADRPVDAVPVNPSPGQGAVAQLVAGRLTRLLGLEDQPGEGVRRSPLGDRQVAGEGEAGGRLVGVEGSGS